MNKDIELPSSYTDPYGRLLNIDGELVRQIYAENADFYKELLVNSIITSRQKNGNFVKSEPAEYFEDDPLIKNDLFLKHSKIDPLVYCFEWSTSMLKDAALLTLDLNLEISKEKMMLQDASPWNILFEGANPVFLDFTSIVPESDYMTWPAYDQFCRLFLFPIMLYSKKRNKLTRALLQNSFEGVSSKDIQDAYPTTGKISWKYFKRIALPSIIEKKSKGLDLENRMKNYMKSKSGNINLSKFREKMTSNLIQEIDALKFPRQESGWTQYHSELKEEGLEPFTLKEESIRRWIDKTNPDTVTDLGCNQGYFSFICADSGATVIALDSDEHCVEEVYCKSKKNNWKITPMVQDLSNPMGNGGWCNNQFPFLFDRIQGEMVMALALIHHLAFTYNHNFNRIVDMLSRISKKWVIVEFVSKSDKKSQILLSRKEDIYSWYKRGQFVEDVSQKFSIEESVLLDEDHREIFLCRKK